MVFVFCDALLLIVVVSSSTASILLPSSTLSIHCRFVSDVISFVMVLFVLVLSILLCSLLIYYSHFVIMKEVYFYLSSLYQVCIYS